MKLISKCPICGYEDDCLEFVFSAHILRDVREEDNPSYFHVLRLCPNNHVFDKDNQTLEQAVKLKVLFIK